MYKQGTLPYYNMATYWINTMIGISECKQGFMRSTSHMVQSMIFLSHNARGLLVVMNRLPPVGTHKLNDIVHVRGGEMPLYVSMN